MSVLSTTSSENIAIDGAIAIARPFIAARIWAWYHERENKTFRVWLIPIPWRVFRSAVEEIAGQDPATQQAAQP